MPFEGFPRKQKKIVYKVDWRHGCIRNGCVIDTLDVSEQSNAITGRPESRGISGFLVLGFV